MEPVKVRQALDINLVYSKRNAEDARKHNLDKRKIAFAMLFKFTIDDYALISVALHTFYAKRSRPLHSLADYRKFIYFNYTLFLKLLNTS